MSDIERDLSKAFVEYADDFELTIEDDNWDRLRRHFHEDAVREEHAPPLVSFRHEGIDEIIAQWQRIVEGFDRRFERRILVRTGRAEQLGTVVTMPWVGIYRVRDVPSLIGEGKEIARYEGDLISHLETTWSDDTIARMLDWMTKYGARVEGLTDFAATLVPRAIARAP